MKKITAVLAACLLALSLCACAGSPENPGGTTDYNSDSSAVQIANPVSDATPESLLADTGLDLRMAGFFRNVSYYKIDADKYTVAGAKFDFLDSSYDYRAAALGAAEDISGMNYIWTETGQTDDGRCRYMESDEGAGVFLRYDAVPGIMYSLSTDKNFDHIYCEFISDILFADVQGDSGDEDVDFATAMAERLDGIYYGTQPGSAGSSLKAAIQAAETADLFAKYKPSYAQVEEAINAYIGQNPDLDLDPDSEGNFVISMRSVKGSFENMHYEEDGILILMDAGYTPKYLWDDDVAELFKAFELPEYDVDF